MRKLTVLIEVNGNNIPVGEISGQNSQDAVFSYSDTYRLDSDSRAISLSLPLDKKTFSPKETQNYFEGLLPEGFTRRCVAEWMHADEADYLSILAGLGKECLGAVKILDDSSSYNPSEYRKLSDTEVRNLAKEGATESAQLVTKAHLSLTGASGKVGLYYDESEKQWYLPIGEAPSTHIVKQSHIRLKKIVANEQLCLLTAKYLGIDIPDSFIINTGDSKDEDVLFATKRYDRILENASNQIDGFPVPYRLHQEDFAQALGIPAAEKYEKNQNHYLKKLFDLLKNYSSDPINDQLKLWDICVFNYLIGNTDNHIKNLSLIYSADMKSIHLAPAYDIISTMIYDSSTENMALSINGIYDINQITRKDFEREANLLGLGSKMAMKRFDQMVKNFNHAIEKAKTELEKQGFDQMEGIKNMILEKGSIRFYIR